MNIDPNWAIVIATFAGPIVAVQAQKFIEQIREGHAQRMHIFRILMSSQSPLSSDHVQALNMISIEFRDQRFKAVISSWKAYMHHLNSPLLTDPQMANLWGQRRGELLVDLLCVMGKSLGYPFDGVDIKNGIYAPAGQAEAEMDLHAIRKGVLQVLSGRSPISVKAEMTDSQDPDVAKAQLAFRTALIELLQGERALNVVTVPDEPHPPTTPCAN